MKHIRLFKLCWTIVLGLCVERGLGLSLCSRMSEERGAPETLCDLEFCTCRNPFGRVRCACPGEDPEEEIVIKSNGACSVPPDTTSLSLDNCNKVTVMDEAFQEAKAIQTLEVTNAKEVVVEGRIFPRDGPTRSIQFTNSTIPELPTFAFSGNLISIVFENSQIGSIRAFAFSSIQTADHIVFRNTSVKHSEAQAFKKFPVNKFILSESHFNIIPSRFVADVTVDSIFKIESTSIDEIKTSGFKISNPKKVLVVDSVINKLHSEAFKIVSRGEVVLDSNVWNTIDNEAFRGMSLDNSVLIQSGKQKFKFQNQTVTNLENKSLYINRSIFDVQINKLMIDELCTCDGLVLWKDIIGFGKQFQEPSESELEPIWCRMESPGEDFGYESGSRFYKDQCTKLTTSIYFFVIIITATSIVISLAIVISWCWFRRRKKWKPVPSSALQVPQKQDKTKGNTKKIKRRDDGKLEPAKGMIVPDGRTYKETEFHIIVEKAEPLTEECVPYAVVRDRSRTQIN